MWTGGYRGFAIWAAVAFTSVAGEAGAADLPYKAPETGPASFIERRTLTGDWFGQGPAMRAAGFDFRLEWISSIRD